MKTKLLTVALLASAALITPLQAGGGHHGGGGGGGGNFAARGGGGGSARFGGGGPSFRSAPMRSFNGGGRMMYSGQRFSSSAFRPHYVNSNVGSSIRSRQFTSGNFNRGNQFTAGNINRGNNAARFANRSNASTNLRRGGNNPGGIGNGNRSLRSDWRSHAVSQHSGNWHRNWDRHHDHFFNGHRFVFIDGFWWGFDAWWWPWWGYPDYYSYGWGYPYQYQYGYDPGYYDSGAYDDQNSYSDQSGDSSVSAAQQALAQQGYYRGQIDGVFGPETRAAIAEYQSNHGLRVTGALSSETLAALGLRRVASY